MTQEIFIKIIADGAMIPAVLIGIYALVLKIPSGHRVEAYKRILLAGLTAYLAAKIIGYLYQPSSLRPFELIGSVAGASFLNNPGFPSDHTLFLTAITWAVWFEARQKNLAIIMAVLITIVCIGRVLALVHTPLDVIGGVLIASIGIFWYFKPFVTKK